MIVWGVKRGKNVLEWKKKTRGGQFSLEGLLRRIGDRTEKDKKVDVGELCSRGGGGAPWVGGHGSAGSSWWERKKKVKKTLGPSKRGSSPKQVSDGSNREKFIH